MLVHAGESGSDWSPFPLGLHSALEIVIVVHGDDLAAQGGHGGLCDPPPLL